jgi:hypothetical protein
MRSLQNLLPDVRLWRGAGLLALCVQACLNPIPDEEPSAQEVAPGDSVGAAGAATQPSTPQGMPGAGAGGIANSPPPASEPESPAPDGVVDVDSGPRPPDAGPAADAGASDGGA